MQAANIKSMRSNLSLAESPDKKSPPLSLSAKLAIAREKARAGQQKKTGDSSAATAKVAESKVPQTTPVLPQDAGDSASLGLSAPFDLSSEEQTIWNSALVR